MTYYTDCTTQAEVDAAIANGKTARVRAGHFEVREGTIEAHSSATVRAYDSATVRAYDSATVRAYSSATVWAYNSATVTAYDSATVRAHNSATVRAHDSATVWAYDSAAVTAYSSATVTAYSSATVTATPHVAVHRMSKSAKIEGGVEIVRPNLAKRSNWLAYYGIEQQDNTVVLYKAVASDFTSDRGTRYAPGDTPVAKDYGRTDKCGGGLHLSPRPDLALRYYQPEGVRFVACKVRVQEIVPITDGDGSSDKCKVKKVLECVEVDAAGVAK